MLPATRTAKPPRQAATLDQKSPSPTLKASLTIEPSGRKMVATAALPDALENCERSSTTETKSPLSSPANSPPKREIWSLGLGGVELVQQRPKAESKALHSIVWARVAGASEKHWTQPSRPPVD